MESADGVRPVAPGETPRLSAISPLPAMIDALADLRAGRAVVLFNKPFGMLCQFTDDGGRPTLRDAVPVPEVYPAGRLDADSEGLVVLTAHGPLQARIAHPRHKLAKTYWVQVEGAVSDAALGRLTSGVELNDGLARARGAQRAEVPDWLWPRVPPIRERRAIPTGWLVLQLAEGRNRQVRRMTAAAGLPTLRLVRTAVGRWALDGLAPGEWRVAPVL